MSATVARECSQRERALVLANEVRSSRSRLKRDLKQGVKSPLAVLVDPPVDARGMRLLVFLEACPRIGPVTANRVLWRLRISPGRTLGALTARQRGMLVRVLGGRDA